jgi:geranylgeranyl diphosphate synthase type II
MQNLLEKINQKISSISIPTQPAELYEPVTYTLSLGGKRMRPVLALLGYSLYKTDYEKALDAAVALEVFHNFTLLHDDIMDNAPLRRGKPTVWQKWGSSTAILSGDAMFIKSYELLSAYEGVLLKKLLPVFNKTALEICEGQQLDMNFETTENVSIADYLHMIELKTAVLLGAALQMGALVSGATDEDAENLYEFGKNTGIAFQLQDDILDVFGETEKVGKQTGGDIISNKKTFLLLKAFELADKTTTGKLNDLVNEKNEQKKVEEVKEIYHLLEVKKLAEAEMQKFYNKGLSALKKVNAPAEKKKVLTDFTEQLMQRQS